MFLSVIIPAYNEEKRLPVTLKKMRDYLAAKDYGWEVLIVNDGSKDKTAEVVREFINGFNKTLGSPFAFSRPSQPTRSLPPRPRSLASGESERDLDRHFAQGIPSGPGKGIFRLIDNKENKGKGGVVKQGMLEAKGEWRLFMDADGSTDLKEIEKLWPYTKKSENGLKKTENGMENGKLKTDFQFPNKFPISSNRFPIYDIIIGSRYLKKDSIKIKQPLGRRIVSRMGNWLIRIMLGINMADTQCGFKLFSAKAVEEIFPLQTIERWGFDTEILAIARKKDYKVKEVAVDWYDAEGSTVKKTAAFKTLKELMIIKWNLMRGKYS